MINSFDDKFGICKTHNLKQEFLNPDKSNQNQKLVCQLCIQQYYGIVHVYEAKQTNLETFEIFCKQSKQNSEILNQLIEMLLKIKQDFIKNIKIIENIIVNIKNQNQEDEKEIQQLSNTIEMVTGIQRKHWQYLDRLKNQQIFIQQQLQIVDKNYGVDNLLHNLNQLDFNGLNYEKQQNNKIKIQEVQYNFQQNQIQDQKQNTKVIKYQYELLNQPFILQRGECLAIAFNMNNSIIVAGCDSNILVFEFKNEQLKLIQEIIGHYKKITTLLFMKICNKFISGSYAQIQIWSQNNQNEWINIQTLNEYSQSINCLILNSNEDLMISGSNDKSIKFWKLKHKEWKFHQTIKCSSLVLSLSLNDSNKKLISSEEGQLIQIYEPKEDKWVIVQKINVEKFGYRLCFISEYEFVFLSYCDYLLHFWKFNHLKKQFQINYEVQVNGIELDFNGFPTKFIKSKNLLIVKRGEYINVLKKLENSKFYLDKSIIQESHNFIGNVSEDGEFLITWNDKSLEYQISKLNEIIQ